MSGFREAVAGLPEQLRATPVVDGTLPRGTPLVVAGVGGSGMAGEFLALFLSGERPVRITRDVRLPEGCEGSSVLCVSYSGETAETLAVWREARARGLPTGVVASGGRLLAEARAAGAPHARVAGGLAPRLALGYQVRAAAGLCGAPSPDPRFEEAARHLRGVAERWGGAAHAEGLVGRLASGWPVVVASDPFTSAAARRWVSQLSENAKVPALRWEFPEALHNEIMSLTRGAPRRDDLHLVALGEPPPGLAPAWERTLASFRTRGIGVEPVSLPHADRWVEALGLAYAGDWVSYHLALRLGVDPGDISFLETLKRERGDEPARDVETS